MAILLSITQGWTQRLGPFTLKVDNEPLDLTGMEVRLFLRGKPREAGASGVLAETDGDVVADPDQVANTGQVYWDPDAGDLDYKKSPYTLHFEVKDGDEKVAFFPHGEPDEVLVYQP